MNKVQIKFLEEALDNEEHLTEWEAVFVNNLVGKEERDLSEKQNEVLNRIQKKLHSMNLL